MINLVREKNPMTEQDTDVRNKNFLEVAVGYTEEMAVNEAMRCLKCRKKPCMSGCPVMVKIPDFIAKVAEGEFEEAYQPDQFSSGHLRTRMSSGDSVRGKVRAR